MTVSPPTFPLSGRFRATLYVLVLTAVAAFAHTEGDITPLLLTGVAAAIAWLLVDSGAEPVNALLRRGLARLLAVPLDLRGPGAPPLGAAPAHVPEGGARQAVGRWLIASCSREKGVPKLLLNTVVLLAAVNLWREVKMQFDQGNQSLIISLAHFMLALLLCKLFEKKGVRDAVQILVLSLLIVVAATMFSTSGLFFFCILGAYFLALFCATVLLNLAAETQRLGGLAPMPAVIPASGPGRAAGKGRASPLWPLRRDLRTVVQHCVFLIIPVAVAVFLIVPRTRGNPLLTPWGLGNYQTGYTDVVQFRDYGQLSQSDEPVMKVRLSRNGDEVGAEFNDLYFRGDVLDEYDRRRDAWIHAAGDYTPASPARPQTDLPRIDVSFELMIPYGRTAFIIAPSLPPQSPAFAYSAAGMTWQFRSAPPRSALPVNYTQTWVRNLPPAATANPYVIPGQLAPAPTNGPEGQTMVPTVRVSPQVDQLAHALIKNVVPANQRVPLEQIRGVVTIFENYLRTNYPYSLTFRQVDHQLDRTTDFLVNRKATGGHCEYFASAMVMLCRAVGLNARMVNGYHGGEYVAAPLGPLGDMSYFLVRQKNAHAWAEVYIPDQGWVLSDPSPGAGNGDATAAAGRWYSDIVSLLQSAWMTTVVSFDNDSRAAIARWLSSRFEFLLNLQPFSLGTTAALWGALLLLTFLAIKLRRRFRRLAPLIESTRGIPHRQVRLSTHIAFLEDLLHLFDRADARRPDLTPLEFLRPHFSRLGRAAEDAHWLIVTAYGMRFGGLQVDADLKHEIARALKNVKSALRARTNS